MNKFQTNDTVKYLTSKPPGNFNVIRFYKAADGTFKYDISSQDGSTLIIANPEAVLELVKQFISNENKPNDDSKT